MKIIVFESNSVYNIHQKKIHLEFTYRDIHLIKKLI